MEKVTKYIHVFGKVQGVGYRATLRALAYKTSITGWVRNLPDGSVEAVLQGHPDIIKKVLSWCHQGPKQATIDNILVRDLEEYVEEYKDFQITY